MQQTTEIKTVLSEVLDNNTKIDCYHLEYPESYGYEKFSTIWESDLLEYYKDKGEDIPKGKYYYSCPYLRFGDYDNSCNVERSNVRMFLELAKDNDFTDFLHVKGDYSSEAIYIDIMADNTEIIDCLNHLFDYPAINDEDCSLMTIEMESEAWEGYVKGDFIDAIKKHYDAWDIDCISEDKLIELFHKLKEDSNTYESVESGGNYYIDIDRLITKLPADYTELKDIFTFDFNND